MSKQASLDPQARANFNLRFKLLLRLLDFFLHRIFRQHRQHSLSLPPAPWLAPSRLLQTDALLSLVATASLWPACFTSVNANGAEPLPRHLSLSRPPFAHYPSSTPSVTHPLRTSTGRKKKRGSNRLILANCLLCYHLTLPALHHPTLTSRAHCFWSEKQAFISAPASLNR